MNIDLAPVPQLMRRIGGTRSLRNERTIVLAGDALAAGMQGARDLQAALNHGRRRRAMV